MMSHTALANLHRTRAIPNRGDSMRSRAADINTDRLAFDEAVERVMGPAATAQLEEALYAEFAKQSGKAVAEPLIDRTVSELHYIRHCIR